MALGIVRPEVDADALFDIVVGAILFRMLVSTAPPSDAIVDSLSEIILNGVAKAAPPMDPSQKGIPLSSPRT